MDLFTSAAVLQCSISYKVCYLLLAFLFPFCQTLLARAPALVPLSPFVSILNAPTELCMKKFKINVDIGLFQMTGSTLRSSRGQNISLFYTDRLGYYPYINLTTGQSYNGGIPQMVNMDQHLKKAKEDILYYMPYSTQKGLAVIDWEDWRPSWIRNWASKTIYRDKSIEFALKNDLTLNKEKATEVAKAQFEFAAKSLMLNTLKLGKSLRPEYLWGFYNFPNCQNYDYNQHPDTYNGNCPDIEKSRNDELSWLWIESSVFYVNIYLESSLKSKNNAALYSRCRIQETMRLSSLSNSSYSLPIYAYFRPVYTDQYEEYLSKYDLINTIGESAALGAAGFILWGDTELTVSERTCTALNNYLIDILNPYIINVTLAAKLCSAALCQNNGACVRKQWNSHNYLHLNGNNMIIEQKFGSYSVRGQPTLADLEQFADRFTCDCYVGSNCKVPSDFSTLGQINICIKQNICINASFTINTNPNIKTVDLSTPTSASTNKSQLFSNVLFLVFIFVLC
ncbi:hyaluronidase PH-20-like [Bombina bombina]|uniref:hyaluronidase PH-20-like n=1 Tax=Bombina bombina TaxID=8345 RepID=UPI00235A761C|nr:hyaluronidase PH-20-like [Bombina bombina]